VTRKLSVSCAFFRAPSIVFIITKGVAQTGYKNGWNSWIKNSHQNSIFSIDICEFPIDFENLDFIISVILLLL
jgi:hypothetical protein